MIWARYLPLMRVMILTRYSSDPLPKVPWYHTLEVTRVARLYVNFTLIYGTPRVEIR